MFMSKSILVGLGCFSLCMANISGIITDTSGTIAMPGAIVQLEKGGQTAIAGADGRFTLVIIQASVLPGFGTRLHQSARIHNGLLYIDIAERSVVEVAAFDLNGKTLAKKRQTVDAGTPAITLPRTGSGVYLYKVRLGAVEFVMKGHATGSVSQGRAAQANAPALQNAMAKAANLSASVIDDVISVTLSGYLNHRVMATNSDTSGIKIQLLRSEGWVADADGNSYQTVKVGNQVWTVENLRTTKYNDGIAIPRDTSSETWAKERTPKYCYYNNTVDIDFIKKFGALYNWFAVDTKKLAPSGWHVASIDDWDTLQNYLIAHGYNWDLKTTDNNVAKALAGRTDWWGYVGAGSIGDNMSANNRSGLSAFPGGCRTAGRGAFNGQGSSCLWWSATEINTSSAYYRSLSCSTSTWGRYDDDKRCGYSIRLVRDY
jgi:uncharacterized protein (TIGR02145 family)